MMIYIGSHEQGYAVHSKLTYYALGDIFVALGEAGKRVMVPEVLVGSVVFDDFLRYFTSSIVIAHKFDVKTAGLHAERREAQRFGTVVQVFIKMMDTCCCVPVNTPESDWNIWS